MDTGSCPTGLDFRLAGRIKTISACKAEIPRDMGRVLQLILILVFSSYCVSEESVLVSNSWAVEVRGGSNVAEQVARRHGFVNKGLVMRQRVVAL